MPQLLDAKEMRVLNRRKEEDLERLQNIHTREHNAGGGVMSE